MRHVLVKASLLALLCLAACGNKSSTAPPDNKEIYNFFLKQMKQTATASGYQKYRLKLEQVKQTAPTECPTQDGLMVACFSITVNRTEYYDNYTGTYTTKITNDTYRLYRDEYGQLAIAEHTPGQTDTQQAQRSWRGGDY